MRFWLITFNVTLGIPTLKFNGVKLESCNFENLLHAKWSNLNNNRMEKCLFNVWEAMILP